MKMKKLRCAVIGAGAIGSAAAYALARRGAKVTVFEQYDQNHNHGSSHGTTRMLRMAYYEHSNYVPLIKLAVNLWRDLEGQSHQTLFRQSGVLLAGYENGALIPGVLKAAKEHSLTLEHIPHKAAAERYQHFSLPREMQIINENKAGMIFADKAIASMIKGGLKCGATINYQCPVQNWEATRNGVKVYTDDKTELFDRLIVTTGAWANDLLGDIGAAITPVFKHLFWTAQQDKPFTHEGGFIPFAIETKDLRFFYGFPSVGAEGIKIAEHTGGYAASHPSIKPPTRMLENDKKDLRDFLECFAPTLSQPFIKHQKCQYEVSPDHHFILDQHPNDNRVSFAIGLSGHGFKFAPVLGKALADLAYGKPLTPEFHFLSLGRFG